MTRPLVVENQISKGGQEDEFYCSYQ